MNSNISEIIIVFIKCSTLVILLLVFKKEIAELISKISSFAFEIPSLKVKIETLQEENKTLREIARSMVIAFVSFSKHINTEKTQSERNAALEMLNSHLEKMQKMVNISEEEGKQWVSNMKNEFTNHLQKESQNISKTY